MTLKVSQRNILRKTKPGQERCSKNWRLRCSSAESLLVPINEAKAGDNKENYLVNRDIMNCYTEGLWNVWPSSCILQKIIIFTGFQRMKNNFC